MGGEVEVFSEQCSMKIPTFPKFSGHGRTVSLLDEELILLGNDGFGTKGQFITIQKPRNGLLAMKYTVDQFPLGKVPHQHSSLVSRNTLSVCGGKFKSNGKLSKYTWTELSLFWDNGTKFSPNMIDSCNIKVGADLHLIFGGAEDKRNDQQGHGGRQVVKINTTEEIAVEFKPMRLNRFSHSCQRLTQDIVLVSGGISHEGEPWSAIQ